MEVILRLFLGPWRYVPPIFVTLSKLFEYNGKVQTGAGTSTLVKPRYHKLLPVKQISDPCIIITLSIATTFPPL